MKIQPIASPHALAQPQSNEASAKTRAIEAFNRASQGQAQEHPVQNANQVSVEELGAIQAQSQPTETTDKNTEDVAQEETSATSETPVEEKKPETDPALSRQFAQLARQERALRAKAQQQEQAYKQREADLQAREAALNKTQFDPKDYIPRARLQQDALGVLEAEGITTYEQLTERALQRQPTDPLVQDKIARLEARIQELSDKAETSIKTQQEQQQQSYQTAIRQIESDAKALIKANPEEYEAISKTGTVKEVVKLIERTYHKDGIVLSVEEAAQEVENYLIEENLGMVNRIEKIKKRLAQSNASTTKTDAKPQSKQQTQPAPMKTLTNATASTRQLSAKERAILAFKGELKS